MERSTDRLAKRVYYLAAGLEFGAVFLRSSLVYSTGAVFPLVVVLQLAWLALFSGEPAISRRGPRAFMIYLAGQTTLVFVLLSTSGPADFFAGLLNILSMQVMLRLNPKIGAAWIGFCAFGMALVFITAGYELFDTIALVLVYTAGNIFLGSYTFAIRRAQAARSQNQALARELRQGNEQIQAYTAQLGQLVVSRERNRLARDLHDSVTQTVFSMTLATKSALLLLDRDPAQVGVQLERLDQLAQSALAEMQVLVAELKPENMAREEGLVTALRRYLASGRLPESLSVSLEIEGDQALTPAEERGLFHIAEEALNNVMKHAQASSAQIRLHLGMPSWMEVQDQGQGFDLAQARASGRVGLASMRERADEIGWNLLVHSTPGEGTRVRVEKAPVREAQA